MGIVIGACAIFVALIFYLTRCIVGGVLDSNDKLKDEVKKLEERLKDHDMRIKANTARYAQLEKDYQRLIDNHKPHITFNDEEFTV